MRIITIGREFGSGGRELGKRLADSLGVPCYDKEIIAEVAKLQGITPEHVQRISRSDVRQIYGSTIGRSLGAPMYQNVQALQLMGSYEEIIRRLAEQGDCVIVGRNADVILQDRKPLNIFVFATEEARVQRCLAHIRPGENERSIRRQMQRIDRARASNRRLLTDTPWGSPGSYHLCVNTSGMDVKTIIPALSEYVKVWFAQQAEG